MKKRMIAFGLSALMCLPLAGCGGGGSNTIYNSETAEKIGDTGGLKLPLTDKNETVEWSITSSNEKFNESYVATKLREATGVDVQFRVVPAASVKEKVSVWLASKDLPDILGQGLDDNVKDDMATQGAIAAVEDYIDQLPNFKATFVDNKDNN